VATVILRTIKRTMIDRKLGSLPRPDLEGINRELRRSLGLWLLKMSAAEALREE